MKHGIRKKIIYVDDVNYSLMVVQERLKNRYEIFPAQSVIKLFEILEYVTPDLILLDVNMPDVDGYEAISMLKSDDRYSAIPVVFLTSQVDRSSIVRGISLGAVSHVGKPYSTETLIGVIDNILFPNKQPGVRVGVTEAHKPSILAVDDVTSMLMAINYALRDKYKVYMLSKPQELKEFLQNKTPDLFLLDYNMPVLNGFDLIPIIRGFPEHKNTPVIFLTSEGTADHLTAAIHLGACDFISKPLDTKVLRQKVAKHIEPMKEINDRIDKLLRRD